jgi:hypothetical protein
MKESVRRLSVFLFILHSSSFILHPSIPAPFRKKFSCAIYLSWAQAKFSYAFFSTALAHEATHFLEAVI